MLNADEKVIANIKSMATTFNKYFAEIFAKHVKIKDKYKPSIPEKIFETNFIFCVK